MIAVNVSTEDHNPSELARSEDLTAIKHPIAEAVAELIEHIRALRDCYPVLVESLDAAYADTRSGYAAVLGHEDRTGRPTLRSTPHEMPASKQTEFILEQRQWVNGRQAARDMPRALLLAMMAHWDAFLANLVRAIYESQPDLTRAIDRLISYQDLLEVNDITQARELGIEKDIAEMLHPSKVEQLRWFQQRLKVDVSELIKTSDFIELCERRNVIAHNGGRATAQYFLAVGAGQGAGRVGDDLRVDEDYIERAYMLLAEIGVRLAHLCWRQVRPDQDDKADKVLARLGYELLVCEEFKLALRIHQFATHSLTPHDGFERRRFRINLAQSYKWTGSDEQCRRALDAEDWTEAGPAFDLALAVLRDDFDLAGKQMIAAADDVAEKAFTDWPLFRVFRGSSQFAAAYQQLYGRSFT